MRKRKKYADWLQQSIDSFNGLYTRNRIDFLDTLNNAINQLDDDEALQVAEIVKTLLQTERR